MQPSADPNFPAHLDIAPLHLANTSAAEGADAHGQADAIRTYGIAGRVWEATAALVDYLTPPASASASTSTATPFDPPCSLFTTEGPHTVLELGSGQALASLYLAARLRAHDEVVLTDLPAVVPLMEASVAAWRERGEGARASRGELGQGGPADVTVHPLAWGESAAHLPRPTHILMCDLVYFPHLYPPLLRTLLEVTEPAAEVDEGDDVFGPEVILACKSADSAPGFIRRRSPLTTGKSRTLALEESFFDAFAHYFRLEPVTGGSSAAWDDTKIFVCRRWRTTSEWRLPPVERVMAGAPGVLRGHSFGLEEGLYAALEWD